MIYNIYTDGSALGNGKKLSFGGWAFFCVETEKDGYGYDLSGNATNNIEELTAILEAIKYGLTLAESDDNVSVIIHSDSQYSIDSLTKWIFSWKRNGWRTSKGEPVMNKELINEIYNLIKFPTIKVSFVKVKGHNGNKYNERVDAIAVSMSEIARNKYTKERK